MLLAEALLVLARITILSDHGLEQNLEKLLDNKVFDFGSIFEFGFVYERTSNYW